MENNRVILFLLTSKKRKTLVSLILLWYSFNHVQVWSTTKCTTRQGWSTTLQYKYLITPNKSYYKNLSAFVFVDMSDSRLLFLLFFCLRKL